MWSDRPDAPGDRTLISSKIGQLGVRLLRGDITWLLHRVSMAAGLRASDTRPVPLMSKLGYVSGKRHPDQSHPLRLLVFSHNLDREGASISLKELVCGLKTRHAVVPEVISFGDGPLRSEYEACGIAVEVLPSLLHRISTTKRLDREVTSLAKRIQASACDVIFVNTLLNFPAILAAEHAGVPSVWNPRESEPWSEYFRFLPAPVAQQAIAAIGLPRRVVFVAESTRAVWKEFEQDANFTVIHNSLHLDRFAELLSGDKASVRRSLGWSTDEVVFLCVGTLCERKGQQDALQALEKIADHLKVDVRLVFVGDPSGRYGQEQQRFALRFKGNNRVRICFEASTANIGNYYLAADVFLLCSRVESYPRVVLEALAFSLPIITTPVFGVVEQIPDLADAFFYAPGDVAHLSKHMLEMANSPKARQQLSQCSRARFAEMASFDQMLKAYESVLRDAEKYAA
jgi:glycosyltransferase involved in cell wall biosynthesis